MCGVPKGVPELKRTRSLTHVHCQTPQTYLIAALPSMTHRDLLVVVLLSLKRAPKYIRVVPYLPQFDLVPVCRHPFCVSLPSHH